MLRRAGKKSQEMAKQRFRPSEGAEESTPNGDENRPCGERRNMDLTNRTLRPMLWCRSTRAESALSGGVYGGGTTAEQDNTEKVRPGVMARRMGPKILPPDITSWFYHLHVNDDGEIVWLRDQRSVKVRLRRSPVRGRRLLANQGLISRPYRHRKS